MDWALLERYLPLLVGVCTIGLLALVWAMARAYREAKTSLYFLIREQATLRLQRLVIVTVPILAVTIALTVIWLMPGARPTLPPTPIPTLTPTATAFYTPTATPTPTATATARATPTATITPTSTPWSETPVAGLPSSMLTPVPDAVTPGPDATFVNITFARDVSGKNDPVDPATVFPEGIPCIYAFFTFEGMSPGVAWTYAWYQDGTEIWSQTGLWKRGAQGTIWTFYCPGEGYTAGEYEVRLYIGEDLQRVGRFQVAPAPPPGD